MARLLLTGALLLLAAPRLMRSAGASGSSSSAVDEGSSGRSTSGDSCGYYALEVGQDCRKPRSCYDCLNVALADEPQGCLLSEYGVCESMALYDPSLDYRADGSSADSGSPSNYTGGWFHQFPASNSTYCEASDAACVECNALARNLSAEDNFMAQTTKFCVGDSGCVCILSCEESVFEARTSELCETTSAPSPSTDAETAYSGASSSYIRSSSGKSKKSHATAIAWITAVTVSVPLALAIGFYVRYVRPQVRSRRARSSLSSTSSGQLQLAGWRAMHEELIEQQKELGGSRHVTISPCR